MTALQQITDSLARGLYQRELDGARATLAIALSHLEQAYNMGQHLPVSPAEQLAVSIAHQSAKTALAHLALDCAPAPALDCGGGTTPLSHDAFEPEGDLSRPDTELFEG